MATSQSKDALTVTTILVERPRMLRTVLFEQLKSSSIGMAQAVEDEAYYAHRGSLRATAEKKVRKQLAEVNEVMMLLGQLGWR